MADLHKAATCASAYSLLLRFLCITLFVRYTGAVTTSCVVQAFGTGLEGKGIAVELQDVGFGCPDNPTWRPVSGSAQFDSSGEAEVALQLDVDSFGVCSVAMNVAITLPADHGNCRGVSRTVSDISWSSNISGGVGSCRALKQECGSLVSNAAIPYIDMWCSTPSGIGNVFEGQPQLMSLTWIEDSDDSC